MLLPLVSFEQKEKYLLVIGHGKRDSLGVMAEASALIYEKVLETKSRYLLVDYRQLEVHVNLSDAFNIVKRYEVVQPELKNIKIAALFSNEGEEFGLYWRDIGRQRGFTIEAFDTFQEAEKWLLDQQKNS